MACSGAHCTNHGTGTATCGAHRTSCAANRTLGAGNNPPVGTIISSAVVDDLRDKIRAEVTRWNLHSSYSVPLREDTADASLAKGDITTDTGNNLLRNLHLMVKGIYGSAPNVPASATAVGAPLGQSYYKTVRDAYNIARQNCICNSDCSCNNVCACHNNCGCNYSDKRLKQEITYC